MFDEAHVLAESVDLLQQLRHIVRMTGLIGVVFAGEPAMNKMFTTKSSPFYLQATVIPVENFVTKRDIGECAILPLSEAERPLMSPMTIDYLARLTQGKPNQIRLICYSIYRRYLNGQQRDLDITIEALDDVLDTIQASYASEYDLKDRIERVRRLSSVDLEALYLATRYPDWRVDDIVALDEAFRGEQMSPRAVERRRSLLNEKHGYFVSMSLLQDRPDKYILAGDEFLYLYLRFWYEVRKYGELRRRLEIGEEPITPFGEKVDKLIRSLAWEVRQPIALVSVGFAHGDAPKDKFIHHIKQRFSAVDNLLAAKPFGESEVRLVLECFRICQMIRRAGRYYLLVIAVRDLQNPRESILAEVYFNCEQPLVFPLRIIRQQAEAARILVEEFEAWTVEVPTLAELVRAVSGTTLEELLARLGPFEQWTMKSIQRFIESGPGVKRKEETEASASKSEWIELYQRGKTDAALAALSEGLAKDPKRPVAARLYNDRGYIRYEMPGQTEAAIRDLERALDLHHSAGRRALPHRRSDERERPRRCAGHGTPVSGARADDAAR